MLYVRMLLIMVVSLYTSRIILNALGIEDYGLHNVVGGVVLLLSFLNNAMAMTTQRFLNFQIGQKNSSELKRIFSMSINIHLIIALFMFLLLETIGLWLLSTQLSIPENRFEATKWVFHFSIFSLMLTIIVVPYYSSIIAYERMTVFAYIGVLEAVLKLLVAFIIPIVKNDKLIMYSILLSLVTVIVQAFYFLYSRLNFKECRYYFFWDKKLFYSLSSFAAWNLFGSIATVAKNHGVNILLNIFFGPTINAAKGISFQVNGALTSFVTNFQTALKPQIVKSYASGNIGYHHKLVFFGAKYSFFLLYILCLPLLLETEIILRIWLKIVPDYTVIFVRLILLIAIIDSLSVTLMASIQATGKIKIYQMVIGLAMISILPISYILFKNDYPPESTYYVSMIIFTLILGARIYLVKKQTQFRILDYFNEVIFKAFLVTISSISVPLIIQDLIDQEITRMFITSLIAFFTTAISIYFLGISIEERINIKYILKKNN